MSQASHRTRLAFFGSSLVSAYWNGAATYYRGILSALHRLGYDITFYEPDAFGRQQHRDLDADPEYARVVVYPGDDDDAAARLLRNAAADCDVLVKASGVGVYDELLEREAAAIARGDDANRPLVLFWDVDAPATLERMRDDPADRGRACTPAYDAIFTYGGGPPVVAAYQAFGARRCVPIYNAHDPETHHPPTQRDQGAGTGDQGKLFSADLAFLGNRLPDREARVDAFFFDAARRCPDHTFLLGGSGWEDKAMPPNVRYLGHVGTADHNAFNAEPRTVLNISRASMAAMGYSPATRVFEAAAAGACLITDAWEGVDRFFAPDGEVLVAEDGEAVAGYVRSLDPQRCRAIGAAARRRALRDHTYADRARTVHAELGTLADGSAPKASAGSTGVEP